MIYSYGIKIRGEVHLKDDSPCQDAYKIVRCGDDMVIAAVADGLGSCVHSNIASQLAVDIATEYCVGHLAQTSDTDEILKVIRASFCEAQDAIEEKSGNDLPNYYTTLVLAVLCGDTLYYGQSGDSGIVAMTVEGRFEKVTSPQNDESGGVFPLHCHEKWEFKQYDKKVCSILLATDGILLRLCPSILEGEPIEIDVSFALKLMENHFLCINEIGEDKTANNIRDYISQLPSRIFNDDDLTIVTLVNTAIDREYQPQEYYDAPDWEEIGRKREKQHQKEMREEFRHLYPQEETSSTNSDEPAEADSTGISAVSSCTQCFTGL